MTDLERQASFVGQLLKLDLKQAHTRTVRTAAIRRDRQLLHAWVARAPHDHQPAPDRIDRELRCVVADADTHTTSVRGDVINAIRRDFSKLLVNEIMHVDLVGATFRAIVDAANFVRT